MLVYLLSPNKKQFKANLHCHSNRSDGKLSPEALKQAYQERGYQILSITDHEAPKSHAALSEDGFLLLTGYEAYIRPDPHCAYNIFAPEIHLNLFARDPDNESIVCFNPYYCKYISEEEKESLRKVGSQRVREYTVDYINAFIQTARDHGYLVSYNHPVWSLQEYADYAGLQGLWAMEVYNNHCHRIGYDDNNSHIYQTMLKLGNRFYPLATDDFHRIQEHNFIAGGWVMVGAEKLSYPSVISALEKGDFYASTGPVIHSLDVDGTVLKLRCSGVRSVKVFTQSRHATELTHYDGTLLEEAEFDLAPWLNYWKENGKEGEAFIRLMFIDAHGNNAYTRAYWYDELV